MIARTRLNVTDRYIAWFVVSFRLVANFEIECETIGRVDQHATEHVMLPPQYQSNTSP
jgi:hypothetical protein